MAKMVNKAQQGQAKVLGRLFLGRAPNLIRVVHGLRDYKWAWVYRTRQQKPFIWSQRNFRSKLEGFVPEWAWEWKVLARLFLELCVPIGLEKFLTSNLLGVLLPNLDMMLLGYILKCGMSFMKIHHHLPIFSDLTSGIMELGFHPSFLYSPDHKQRKPPNDFINTQN